MLMRIYNAAGPRSKLPQDLYALLEAPVSVITIGSISLQPQIGNRDKKYLFDPKSGASFNSMGLPNAGIAYYEKFLPGFISAAHRKRKKVRVSIVGSMPQEYAELVRRLSILGVDEIEVNTSCPNVWHGTKQKRIACFDLSLLTEIISATVTAAKNMRLDYKVSPYSDPELLRKVALLFGKYKKVHGVVCCNTFPNAFSPKTGLAGLGGDTYRAIVLGQVRQFRTRLPKRIKIVGLGGVSTRRHIQEYKNAGANEVQIGTQYFEKGSRIFRRLLKID